MRFKHIEERVSPYIIFGQHQDGYVDIASKDDDTLSFHTRFYNGGTWLGEMIEYGLSKLKK